MVREPRAWELFSHSCTPQAVYRRLPIGLTTQRGRQLQSGYPHGLQRLDVGLAHARLAWGLLSVASCSCVCFHVLLPFDAFLLHQIRLLNALLKFLELMGG